MNCDKAIQMVTDKEKKLEQEHNPDTKKDNPAFKFAINKQMGNNFKAKVKCCSCGKIGYYQNECSML